MTPKTKIIFFGNGPLSDYALKVLEKHFEIIFHAKTKEDLEIVKQKKRENREAYGILASFGVMIREDVLDLFEPEGILNIHPSLLPKYRGASPIETAILNGDKDFSVSIMKLVKAMDAGPLYYQETLKDLPLQKDTIYQVLAETGAKWLVKQLGTPKNQEKLASGRLTYEEVPASPKNKEKSASGELAGGEKSVSIKDRGLPEPKPQVGEPTFTTKLDKKMGLLDPETDTADVLYRKIVAYQGFPKPKFTFYGINCIILEAKPLELDRGAVLDENGQTGAGNAFKEVKDAREVDLTLTGADGGKLAILRLQPEGRKPMDAKSFLNGYKK